jgi:hypothetical protein
MEHLTKSNFVVDIYGFCGNSGLFEYADGGDIKDALFPHGHKKSNITQLDKLRIGKLTLDCWSCSASQKSRRLNPVFFFKIHLCPQSDPSKHRPGSGAQYR